MECRAVDVFIIHKGRPEKLPRVCAGMKLEAVSNRGADFSLDEEPNFLLVDWHRCRYSSESLIEDKAIMELLEELGKFYTWEKVQKLFVSEDGTPLYSKAHSS